MTRTHEEGIGRVTEFDAASRIAIVGMACRLPGARNVDEFWQNLRGGVESVRRLTRQEMLDAGATPEDLDDPHHVPFGALIDHIDEFDAAFFGITTREAELMDPQQRLFLQCAWEALEDAGYDPGRIGVPVGVFGGANFNSYLTRNLIPAEVFEETAAALQAVLANDKDYLATRVAYKLNLRGPACAVQSGCSTSLVAVHLAAQSLLGYECDMALAGGVAVDVARARGYWSHEGSVFSPDGHCRTFDADARGTVFGNGVGIVVLKRLEDAQRDGDSISAVILGSAVNNDGAVKVGFTAPSVSGQAEVIAEALADAGAAPESIGFIETHGTGTPLGDPIEVEALRRAYGARPGGAPCAIGSVKTNVGHLDSAAGVASLIKTALALRHRELPPSLNFTRPNPAIEFDKTAFYVNTQLVPWTSGTSPLVPRRAAVSSFGMGGTNAHLVLEEHVDSPADPPARSAEVLVWSARSPETLGAITDRLRAYLDSTPVESLADLAYTLQTGRAAFEHRRMVVVGSAREAAALLADAPRAVETFRYTGEQRGVAFVYPANVPDALGAIEELSASEPAFRSAVEACGDVLRAEAAGDLADPTRPEIATFTLQHALTCVWNSWGVTPAAVGGDGVGELAAACAAGVLSYRDALRTLLQRPANAGANPSGGASCARNAMPSGSFHYLELGAGETLSAVAGPGITTGCLSGAGKSAVVSLLAAAGRLWQGGIAVDWRRLHGNRRRRRVAVPTYAFEQSRFWIDPPPQEDDSPEALAGRKLEEVSRWLYVPSWQRVPALELVARAFEDFDTTEWLVCTAETPLSDLVVERLARVVPRICVVRPMIGAEYDDAADRVVTIDPSDATHYARLLEQRFGRDSHLVIVQVGLPAAGTLESFASVLALSRAIAHAERRISVRVITVDAQDVLGSEDLAPDAAPLLAAVRVIAQEHVNVDCACIDVDRRDLVDPAHAGWLADRVVAEAATHTPDPVVAYRGYARWVVRYQPMPIERPPGNSKIKNGGTYVIVGGLGRIGLTLAEHIARTATVNLVLIGRNAIPSRSTSPLSRDTAGGAAVSDRGARVAALEALGSRVLALAADVADEVGLRRAIADAEQRFGRIDGVIAAAGIVDGPAFQPLRRLTVEECERQFRPKVDGLRVLEQVLGDRALDFCLVVSSLSSVLGGLGYGAYSAANAFMDAFVRRHNTSSRTRWMTVNWDAWRWPDTEDGPPGTVLQRLALTPADAVDVFDRVLRVSHVVDQIVVSTADLGARLAQWVDRVGVRGAARVPAAETAESSGPVGSDTLMELDAGDGDLTPTQLAVVQVWRRVLGILDVPLDESFLDLGGNSLTAVQAISAIEQSLGAHVAIEEFIFQTAAQLATLCDRKLAAQRAAPAPAAQYSAGSTEDALVRS
ncbi:MAG: SDR family NAD(P)-dependent oxidoreductase [Vicinamibacterales bacterium]